MASESAARRAADIMAAGWQEVTQEEIYEVCHNRFVFNGCTNAYLCDHYGADNITHIMGIGWFRKINEQ